MKIKKIITFLLLIMLVVNFFIPSSISNEEKSDILEICGKNIDEDTIKITTIFPEIKYSKRTLGEDDFTYLDLIDCGFQYYEGKAKLPILGRMIEIPQNAHPIITINDIQWEYVSLNEIDMPMKIYPVQPSQYKKENQDNTYTIDQEYYNTNEFLPKNPITIEEIKEIRGRRFAIIQIAPVQYNPKLSLLKIMETCDLTIDLPGSDISKTIENIEKYSSISFEELYESIFLNYGFYENMALGSRDPEGLLIIVYDAFSDEIAPLASHKTSLGFDTTTTETSDIPGGPTAQNIKNYIENAYDTWTIPPSYVLLVGDTPQIPTFTGTECYTETDSYYQRMDGDIFADIHLGRFPAATETQVTIMVNKTIYYEEGDFPSTDWIKKAAFIASDDAGLTAEYTHNYVIDTHMTPNNYTCDKIYERLGGSTSDISNALNDGRSLCIYSGHGSPSGWGCVPFYQSNVNALTNSGMYPFVCSHACSTSTYQGTSECFGETWLRAENKGGIAFWGSSCSTYWPEDDVIERRVFDAWWYDGLERIGQMTDKGMYDAYIQNPGLSIEKFIESYNVLGDASIKIWSDDPFTPDYDIQVESISVDNVVPHGETQTVTALVRNVGLFPANGIVVDFIEEGIVINTTTINNLDSMQDTLVSFDWNPAIGTFLIEIESQPIPDEYDLTNNNVNKTVQVIAAPAIDVDPYSFSFMIPSDATDTDILMIYNLPTAEASLDYSITFSGDLNGNWLSANPDSGSINIGLSENVIITVDTTGLNEGEYLGNIIIGSNDLNDPEVIIPVYLTVIYAEDTGVVSINSPSGILPQGLYTVNATIKNFGGNDQTNLVVNCTIIQGIFGTILYENFSGDFLPDGWSQEQPYEWTQFYGNNAGGTAPEAFLYWNFIQGGYACLNSKPVNTLGAPTLKLSFNHSINHYTGSFNCRVLARTDNLAGWMDITPWANPISGDINPEELTVDITDFIGTGTQVRFEFAGTNSNINSWYLDDVCIYSPYTRGAGDVVYTTEESIDIDALTTEFIDFTPSWVADTNGVYAIKVTTKLSGDQYTINDVSIDTVEIFEDTSPPLLSNIIDYPDPQIVDGYVNISLTATDETSINSIYVDITGPTGFTPVNVTMNPYGSNQYFYNTNYSIIGNYSYFIWANDNLGHSVSSSIYNFSILDESYLSVDVTLNPGWNLISVPVINDWYASDLADNITSCNSVSYWDSVAQTYHTYIVGGPPTFDFLVEDGCGYFVDVTQQSTLTIVGTSIISVNVPLKVGWNLLGWYHDYDTTASSLSENITGCNSVSKWNATLQTYDTYIVGGPPTFDFLVTRGMGLFVDVDQESYWYGEG